MMNSVTSSEIVHHEMESETANLQHSGHSLAEALHSRAHGGQTRDVPMHVIIDKVIREDEEK